MSEPYYADDLVTLHHGDCLTETAWLDADALVTDPPYGIDWTQGGIAREGHNARKHQGIANDKDTRARDSALTLWGAKPSVVFGSPLGAPPLGTKQALVWHKTPDSGFFGSVGGFRRDWEIIYLGGDWPKSTDNRSSVFKSSGGLPSYLVKGGHPHAKPVPLMSWLLAHAPDGAIADPFAGSGSILFAARNLGRRAIGVEIDEAYCELIAKRLSQQAFNLEGMTA